jgi:hypothetical protein
MYEYGRFWQPKEIFAYCNFTLTQRFLQKRYRFLNSEINCFLSDLWLDASIMNWMFNLLIDLRTLNAYEAYSVFISQVLNELMNLW